MVAKRTPYDAHRKNKKSWRAKHPVMKGYDTLTLGEWTKARDAEVERMKKEKEQ